MPEMPHLDSAIGVVPEDQKALEQHLIDVYEKEGGQWLEELELPKTERERNILRFAEQAVGCYMREYGRTRDLAMKEENIHILKSGGTEEATHFKNRIGVEYPTLGVILLDQKKSDVDFAVDAFHAFWHAKSFKRVQVLEDKPVVAAAVQGFAITSRDGTITYFYEIEEALTALMEERFYHEVLANDEHYRGEIEERRAHHDEPKMSYPEERRRLMNLIDQLWSANSTIFKNQFKSKQDILDVFIHAQVTGHKLPVARMIDKAYGKHNFRIIGEDTAKQQSDVTDEASS